MTNFRDKAVAGIAATPPDEPPAEQELRDLARPSSALALLAVFRHRNYRLFFTGQLVSLMGTWMQTVAQAWLVYSLTHSPFLLGVTSFAAQVTVFFIAPFGGMVADRLDRRKLLLLTQSLSMLQAALLAGLTLAGIVQVWEIVALAFGLGFINAFDVPTRQSMTLDMVGPGDLRHAIALNSVMFNLARVIGPTLAGAVIAVVGEGVCFALNAASFAAVLWSLILMRLPARPSRVRAHPLREIAEGYRFSLASPQIRTSLMLVAVSSCFGASYLSLMPAFAHDLLHGDAASYGTLMAGVGAGALIGAYGLSLIRERWLSLAPVAAAVCFGLGLIAFSHSHMMWLSLMLLLPTAASLILLGGTTNTTIQIVAGERFRGRVISHYTQSFMGMMPWGSLLLGWAATRFGVSDAVSFGGLVVIASAATAWFARRGQRWRFKRAD
ncbi:MAG: MFS transporter [Alphaproteobacteria bacterium]|nr:MFS transporter [Alphaproteobacteria bacterium]MDE2630765.1 MFS transporter [Alphaproteobacteria bacterium]